MNLCTVEWAHSLQRTVRTAHLSVLMTVQSFNTTQNSTDNLPSYLQTNIIAQTLSIGGQGASYIQQTGQITQCLPAQVAVDDAQYRRKNRMDNASDRCVHSLLRAVPTAAGTVWCRREYYACPSPGSNRTASTSPCWWRAASSIPARTNNRCSVPDMTYNVFGGTLSLTQSINQPHLAANQVNSWRLLFVVYWYFYYTH